MHLFEEKSDFDCNSVCWLEMIYERWCLSHFCPQNATKGYHNQTLNIVCQGYSSKMLTNQIQQQKNFRSEIWTLPFDFCSSRLREWVCHCVKSVFFFLFYLLAKQKYKKYQIEMFNKLNRDFFWENHSLVRNLDIPNDTSSDFAFCPLEHNTHIMCLSCEKDRMNILSVWKRNRKKKRGRQKENLQAQ